MGSDPFTPVPVGTGPKPKHDHTKLIFPKGFLWGAATSAYQVEGNNIHSDWEDFKSAGKASDQYHLYEQDFDLAKKLGHNAHRLSIEWSRIEPEEGKFDSSAITHYKKVLKTLKDRDFTVMLTLHHFTNPQWITLQGGWENGKTAQYFERFVEKVVPELKDYVDLWITINEPGVLMWQSYLVGLWPPQKKNRWTAFRVLLNLASAHKKAYKLIHNLIPYAEVGIAHNIISFDAFHHHSILEGIFEWGYDVFGNHLIYILTGKTHDFLGINYYFNQYISFNGQTRLPRIVDISVSKKDISDLGWEIYPEGIFDILIDISDFHLPVYITENGIASTNDDRRVRFLIGYLKEIYHAIQLGVDVKGYFHWSLIDNFEWADGFEPRFGLVEVDYKNQARKVRPSAYVYKEIIKRNGIPHDLLKLLGHGIKVEDVLKEKIEE